MATNIDPAPSSPNRLQPDDFATRAANFVAWMESLTPAINDLANETEVNAQIAADAAANPRTSSTSLTIGTGSKTLVTDAGVPYYIGQVVRIVHTTDGTEWMQGDITAYDSGTGDLTVNVDQVNGSGTFSDWIIASTFGLAQLRQDGAAVDDLLKWDGGDWVPAGNVFEEFTTSGTWNKSADARIVIVEAIGGGGSGSGINNTAPRGGGGGGGFNRAVFFALDLPDSLSISIGSGAPASTGDGSTGGDSSFGSFLIAKGGGGGTPIQFGTGVGGGAGGGGELGAFAADSETFSRSGGFSSGGGGMSDEDGGSCVKGGAGGGGVTSAGGTSQDGGDGGAGSDSGNGSPGIAPGGGGGAAPNGFSSGAGSDGRVRVWQLV